ncbi:MAG: hypothetical protein KDA93_24675 [Planctomycetaceae bacterium]|nr:hypothetical protein [Planctomycetaceae bacterium]
MPYVEDLNEFTERQACERLWFAEENVYRFQNGAVSDGQRHTDRPADPKTRIELQLKFARRRVADAEEEFAKCKSAGLGFSSSGVVEFYTWDRKVLGVEPSGDKFCDPETGQPLASKALIVIQKIVFKLRDEVKRLESEYGQLPEIKRRREAERDRRLLQQQQEERRLEEQSKCASINI